MNPVTRARRLTLVVLVAYLAVNSLGALLHEHVHAHPATETCCQTHHGASQSADNTASSAGLIAEAAHDHDCCICRVTGQPVVAAIAVTVEPSARVAPDPLSSLAAVPRLLAARLGQSRAPPAAAS